MNQQSTRPVPPPPPPVRKRQTKSRKRVTPVVKPRKKRAPRVSKSGSKGRRPIRRELSAGGIVARQERGQWFVALLKTEHKRGEVWVLPKGHVELHTKERISEAARREVEEEAGIKDLSVRDQLGVTRFTFQAEDALVRKTVHYFLMTTGQKVLVPQAEEGFIDAAWFPIDVAIQTLEYDTDQEIVSRARERLIGPITRPQTARRRFARVHT